MRIGQNPSKAKGSPAYQPAKVGTASLTYVPALEGYFRQAREVIEVHLESLRSSLSLDFDLCVFDNGSCPEVIDFLQDQWSRGMIDWLFLSRHNLGKNGALNWIFSSMPNEFIAYSDSDVFFRKGWLEQSLAVFDSFDRAGMVSAQPVFFDFLKGQGQTARSILATGGHMQLLTVEPEVEVLEEYCDGINATPEQRRFFEEQKLSVAYNSQTGQRAVTSATDMQFMLRRDVARKLVPMPIAGALTGKDAIEIPRGIENTGYWILSLEEPLVWHMGNTLTGRNVPEIERLLAAAQVGKTSPLPVMPASLPRKKRLKGSIKTLLNRSPAIKRAIVRLYDGLFGLLYEET
jgi:GT2 family glycosyltransferase